MVRVLVSVYTREEHWPLPAWFPAAYLINTIHNGAAGEHWVGVFLGDSRHAKYFDSYSTTLLESIYQWSQSMCYRDRWYSIRMLQGSFSRSCGLNAFSFLATRSPELPLGAITDVFREYDFAYNEAKIRRLLWCHMHTCWPLPLPEAWKHASPLTMRNITDASGPKKA